MSALINKLRRRPSHEAAPYRHLEEHFESAEIVRDTIIGLSGKMRTSKNNKHVTQLNAH
jgi:hypothetical protein